MLPEVGMSELVVIAIVALIVVGPKDLPMLLRRFGQFMAKLRGMASEFRASFDEMARQSELDDLRKEVEAMRRGQFADMADTQREMAHTVGEIEQSMADVGVNLNPPMTYLADTPAPGAPEPGPESAPKPPRKPRAKKAVDAAVETLPVQAAKTRKPRAARTAGTVEASS